MRSAYPRMWWVVPCTSRKSLQTDCPKDIEEILKTKLAIIKEEPEMCEQNLTPPRHHHMAKKGNMIRVKYKMGRLFMPQFSLKDSCALFMTGFASKGALVGFFNIDLLKLMH
ncbi:hypothetical protein FH972_004402 [Carpinus fangiana]|uniref:Uncharacterized protein n=1 Tax=Carpinus fangiana TaxID=176857 RepID=A0A5N6QPF2_9ROSI|nr:hypothetical protein FH972_004402 [Carpinus fangiana]